MNLRKKAQFLIPFLLLGLMTACSGLPQNEESDELLTEEVASEDAAPEAASSDSGVDEGSDFADLDVAAEEDPVASDDSQKSDSTNSLSEEALSDTAATEVAQNEVPSAEANASADDFQEFEDGQQGAVESEKVEVAQTEVPAAEPADDFSEFETEQPVTESAQSQQPVAETSTPTVQRPAEMPVEIPTTVSDIALIKSVQYKANEAGGTLLVESDKPVQFQTRMNSQMNQLIVEVQNAKLPEKLKRNINMKDIAGVIGSVDAYQSELSTTARFVIQLRSGANTPFVTTEGNSLLVVADKQLSPRPAVQEAVALEGAEQVGDDNLASPLATNQSELLNSKTVNDFLDSNATFYGRKISIETSGMPVKDALRFIADEAGVNIIIDPDPELDSRQVNLKMREVPWDQAFIVILRTNELGYTRIGNLLRVAKVATLAKEEEVSARRKKTALDNEPLKFKIFNINYVKASELESKMEKFKSPRGTIFGNDKSSQLIAQDTAENLKVISDVVKKFDSQPSQVLIEGRIIEATDSFTRSLGVNWGASGADISVGNGVTLRPNLGVNTGISGGNGNLSLQLGTLDILGDLTASLALSELEGKIKIISSPRVVTLSNEPAEIIQGTSVPVIASSGAAAPGAIVNAPAPEFKDVNLELKVTPQVTADASIIMTLDVKRSFLGVSAPGQSQAPIDTRQAKTKILVKNGQTSIIGGVYQNDTRDTTTGVPWLKDLPLVGGLFRSKNYSNIRNELMIFITPRIISVASENEGSQIEEGSLSRAEGEPVEN